MTRKLMHRHIRRRGYSRHNARLSQTACEELSHGEWVMPHYSKSGNYVKGYCKKRDSSGKYHRLNRFGKW